MGTDQPGLTEEQLLLGRFPALWEVLRLHRIRGELRGREKTASHLLQYGCLAYGEVLIRATTERDLRSRMDHMLEGRYEIFVSLLAQEAADQDVAVLLPWGNATFFTGPDESWIFGTPADLRISPLLLASEAAAASCSRPAVLTATACFLGLARARDLARARARWWAACLVDIWAQAIGDHRHVQCSTSEAGMVA